MNVDGYEVKVGRASHKRRLAFSSALTLSLLTLQAAADNPPGAGAPMSMSTTPEAPQSLADWARGAQLFAGLGSAHRQITTNSAAAQRYFDQGIRLMWAFNHDESSRSFARAAELDPRCAMCLWGVALTVGPNYNMPMMAEARAKVAFESLARASQLLDGASPVERTLITALHARYPKPAALDPSNEGPALAAYANAMRGVAHQFPNDSDVQTMFAESLMNINAWKLWLPNGKPNVGTEEIVATLEAVLSRDPNHPGANHYYVHAIEASPHPERALPAAERLRGMMPAAGHLEHMPAHIMQRVGRYEEAAEANRKGAAADQSYLAKTRPLDYYPMYLAHNFQFLAFSTAMEGRKAETLSALKQVRTLFPEEAMLAAPGLDWYGAEPYLAMVRFALWEQILSERAPNQALPGLTGGYLFATTVALAATGRVAEAKQTLAKLQSLRASLATDTSAGNNSAADVLRLASSVAGSRIARAEHRNDVALETLTVAVAQEDALAYDEPSNWFFPVRHLLGAELLAAGKSSAAEAVYREDLRRNPDNGWSLFGLAQALRAQHRTREAMQVDARFKEAWKHADVTLTSSEM